MAKSIDSWMKAAIPRLKTAGIENARLEARLLLCHHLKVDASYLIAFSEQEIANEDSLSDMLERRLKREPLSHITGLREFWSMDFIVTPDVLDPRPDSETLVEALLSRVDDKNAPLLIIDFGTGSGCLLLALLSELPNAKGLGVDVSQAALSVARQNALRLGFEDRCEFIQSSWGDKVSQKADIILSNPPYIPTADIYDLQYEVKNHEPHLALDGGDDGLNPYPILSAVASKLLNKDGLLGFEFGIHQENGVENILRINGYSQITTHRDLGGIARVITAIS